MNQQILKSLELQIADLDKQIASLNKIRNNLFIKYSDVIYKDYQ